MSSNLSPRSSARQYRSPRTVRVDASLSRYVAQGGSRTLGGAHQKELRTWQSARHFITCYAPARALRCLEDLRSHIADLIRPITPERFLERAEADRAEQGAELRFHLHPTSATKEQLIRTLAQEAAEDLALERDLEAQA